MDYIAVILLPLNCLRMRQLRCLIRKVREASRGDVSTEWLIPFMTRRNLAKGDVLFRLGDPGNSMHLILAGSVRILEIGVEPGLRLPPVPARRQACPRERAALARRGRHGALLSPPSGR